jgi:hypothetical protein
VEVTYEAVSTPVIQPTLRAAGGLAWLIPLSGWTPAWLFDRGTSRWRYIAKLGVTSLVPAFVLGFVIAIALTASGAPTDGLGPDFSGAPRAAAFLTIVLIAPAEETLLLSVGIGFISLFSNRPVVIAAVSAIGWGLMHAVIFPVQGVVVTWPFFVFSCGYLAWRPLGWRKAYSVAMGLHVVHNLLPGVMLFVK